MLVLLLLINLIPQFGYGQVQGKGSSKSFDFAKLKREGAKRSDYLKAKSPTANSQAPVADIETYRKSIEPILKESCVGCHGPESEEGNIRLDTLDPDLVKGKDTKWWVEVLGVLNNGEMPPPDEVQMSADDRSKVVDWLAAEIKVASQARRANANHTSFRRMTRYEFNYALQDLLGLSWNFAKDLPPEPKSEDGFQNSSEMLHMSVMQLETYRRSALQALKRATVTGPRPEPLYWGVTMDKAGKVDWARQDEQLNKVREKYKNDPQKQTQELEKLVESFRKKQSQTHFVNMNDGRIVNATWSYSNARYAIAPSATRPQLPEKITHVAVIPQGRNQRLTIELGDRIPDEGILRVRVRAACESSDKEQIPSLQLEFGFQASNEGRAEIRVSSKDMQIDATRNAPKFYQWDVPLGDIYPRNDTRGRSSLGQMPNPSEYIRLVNSSVSQGAILVDYVEVSTPVFDQWPPESHQRLFIKSSNRKNEEAYAREVLEHFLRRAWRRKISKQEVDRKIKLYAEMRKQCDTFEEAMVEVMATALASPNFLYLIQRNNPPKPYRPDPVNRLNDHELASRLAMFLWCSLPDDELLQLADRQELGAPKVLTAQVERMLSDPRARRFSEHFVHQWLDMELLDFLNLKKNFRGFDPLLKESMQREPIEFFDELLRTNVSVLDFIHADFAMLDERLANHYRIPNVKGNQFRAVKLDSSQSRGGLLTQAGLLAMNADGDDSHPLKRGIWLLESILNDPPPPPPPAVPEIDLADPKIAKMTLKQRIENHRNHAACMSCHSKIDPWGIAFENYDALGRYRVSIKGTPVDSTSVLFNKQKLEGMNGLKAFLLENRQDQFVRSMVHKLTTFGLGRPLTFADRSSVDRVAAKVRKEGDGLRTVITQIVLSDLFQFK